MQVEGIATKGLEGDVYHVPQSFGIDVNGMAICRTICKSVWADVAEEKGIVPAFTLQVQVNMIFKY